MAVSIFNGLWLFLVPLFLGSTQPFEGTFDTGREFLMGFSRLVIKHEEAAQQMPKQMLATVAPMAMAVKKLNQQVGI